MVLVSWLVTLKIGLFDMRWHRHFLFAAARGHWFRTAVGISLAHAKPAGPGHWNRTVLFSALPPGPNSVFCSCRDHVARVRPLPGILSRWIRRNRKLSGTRLPLASRPPHQAASDGLFVPHRPRCWPRSGRDPGEYILLSFDHWSCFRRSLWLARVFCLATVKRVSLLVGVLDFTSYQHSLIEITSPTCPESTRPVAHRFWYFTKPALRDAPSQALR